MMTLGIVASAHVDTGVTYDTWTAVASTYGGAFNEAGTSINVGMIFQRNNTSQTLTVHGVRYWRPTTSQAIAPVVGLAIHDTGSVQRSKITPVGAGSTAAGWESVFFDTTYTLNTNDLFVCWVHLRSGGYPATGSAFTSGQDSQLGLYTIGAVTNAGRYAYTTTQTLPPTANATTSSFWVEPLVTLV